VIYCLVYSSFSFHDEIAKVRNVSDIYVRKDAEVQIVRRLYVLSQYE